MDRLLPRNGGLALRAHRLDQEKRPMTSDHGQPAQTFASIGIDIGKDVFDVVGFDASGKVALRKKFKRLALEAELAKLPPSIVGLEASAHRLGHTPRIILAIYVKPFSKGQTASPQTPAAKPSVHVRISQHSCNRT
jgi:hypothetical protein